MLHPFTLQHDAHCYAAHVRFAVNNLRTWQWVWNNENGQWDKVRQVARITSPDFMNWTGPEVVTEAALKDKQPYSMPVFRHAGAYIGLVAMHQQPKSGIRSDRVWPELAWSPDCRTWHRIAEGTPFIPPVEAPSQQLTTPLERRLEDRSLLIRSDWAMATYTSSQMFFFPQFTTAARSRHGVCWVTSLVASCGIDGQRRRRERN